MRCPVLEGSTTLPPRGSKFFVDRTATTVSKCRRGSPSTIQKPRVASHGILIETQRLEFPATRTKQRLRFISNRDKTAVFSSGLPVEAQNLASRISNRKFGIRILPKHLKINKVQFSNRK